MLNCLNTWCKVTVLRLQSCGLGEGGGRTLAETLRLNTSLTLLNLYYNGLEEGPGRCRYRTSCLSLKTCRSQLSPSSSRYAPASRVSPRAAQGRITRQGCAGVGPVP